MENQLSTLSPSTSPQVQKVLGAKREVFRSWVDAGFITPSVQRSSQQGEQNLFDRLDVYGAGLFKHLTTSLKMKRAEAAAHVAGWRAMIKSSPAQFRTAASIGGILIFIRHGGKVISVFSAPSMHEYVATLGKLNGDMRGKTWDDILVVNMTTIVAGIEDKLSKIGE